MDNGRNDGVIVRSVCVRFGGDNHPVLNRRLSTSSWWQVLQVRNFYLFANVYNKICKSLRFNTFSSQRARSVGVGVGHVMVRDERLG